MRIVRAWSASAWSRPFRPLRHALHSYSAPTGVLDSSSEATGFFCNRRQITPEIEEMEKVMEIGRRAYRDGVPVYKCPHYSGRLMAYCVWDGSKSVMMGLLPRRNVPHGRLEALE